ncbi:hypothetical protein ACIPSH_31935 [Streptomyces iakyrus]|uniref:hypothetical protein n=1 Tax=Streptomyces iakyrus TaxID=68219 RepID=UPI0037F98777
MRAVTLAQVPDSPEVTEVEVPRPEAGEVLVKVAASSVTGSTWARWPDICRA